MTQWFGESWGAPVCEPAQHTATPTGEPCAELCGDPIEERDQGFLIPLLREDREPVLLAYHRMCFLRTIIPDKLIDLTDEEARAALWDARGEEGPYE